VSGNSNKNTIDIGDEVIHPIYGAGIIEDFKRLNVLDEEQGFYVLNIKAEKLSLMIPEKEVIEGTSVRKPSSKEIALEAIEILKKQPEPLITSGINMFFREYAEKIKKGTIIDIAEVLRDFTGAETDLDTNKDSKKFLRRVRKVLIQELSMSLKVKENQISKEVNKIFKVSKKKKQG